MEQDGWMDEELLPSYGRGNTAPKRNSSHCRWTEAYLGPGSSSTALKSTSPARSASASSREVLNRTVTRARHSSIPATSKPATISTTLADSVMLRFERDGFVVTRSLLSGGTIDSLRHACEGEVAGRKLESLRHRIRVLCPNIDPNSIHDEAEAREVLDELATDELGFLQFFNLHRSSRTVAQVALGAELAAVAAQLLNCKKVRVYQDALFMKEPGFSQTNWHSDLRMAPFDTNQFVTAWIPLRPVRGARAGSNGAPADSGLIFAAGSHRDFALPFWHSMEGRDLSDRGYPLKDQGPMECGDVSWHHGWTLHCAAPQPMGTPPRLALSVCFFADGSRLLARDSDPSVRPELLHDEDAESYAPWLSADGLAGRGAKALKPGAVAKHRLLPVVWPQEASEATNFPL